MSGNREPGGGLLGLLGVGMAVCCGLPILLGAGVAVGAAGLALGSAAVIAAGVALGFWGWRRRQQHRSCDVPETDGQAVAARTKRGKRRRARLGFRDER